MFSIIATTPYAGTGGRRYGEHTWTIVQGDAHLDELDVNVMLGSKGRAGHGLTWEQVVTEIERSIGQIGGWEFAYRNNSLIFDEPAIFFGDLEWTPRQVLAGALRQVTA